MKSYLGIDISKLHLDLSHPAPAKRLANTEKAILPWLKSLPPETILVCEASGGYEALLLNLAHTLADLSSSLTPGKSATLPAPKTVWPRPIGSMPA